METGKALVLSAVAKQKMPFKASAIVDITGLERQLVHYHMTKFTERGWVEKVGTYYSVIDLEQIVDELVETTSTDTGVNMPGARGLISQATAKEFGDVVRAIVLAKTIGAPMSRDMSSDFNKTIDDSIAYFKALKRYLNNSRPSERTAAKYFAQNTMLYETMVERYKFEPVMPKSEWISRTMELVEAVLDAETA